MEVGLLLLKRNGSKIARKLLNNLFNALLEYILISDVFIQVYIDGKFDKCLGFFVNYIGSKMLLNIVLL